MAYAASNQRYQQFEYRRCGNSGLKLPPISLGLWHNFGHVDDAEAAKSILYQAFDHGITHFDLANNYGPPPGSAESNFGKVLASDFRDYRDELIISTKAGYTMWDGPYGDWGSRKYLLASLDQSLRRMGLDYVDIFYSHRPDPQTPLEETMGALASAVRQGKALYVGISNYPAKQTLEACQILRELNTPCVIHQPMYSMMERWVEDGLLDTIEAEGVGCIPFSPLAQGVLSNRYLAGIPADSRAAKTHGFLQRESITPELVEKLNALNSIAIQREQTLAQLAIAWLLKDARVTSVLIGVSKAEQLIENLGALKNLKFSQVELDSIEEILSLPELASKG